MVKRMPAIRPETVYRTGAYSSRKNSYFYNFCRAWGKGLWTHEGWYSAERKTRYENIIICNLCAKEVGWVW